MVSGTPGAGVVGGIAPVLAAGSLSAWDWAIIAAYMLVLLVSGLWLARREPSGSSEYFLAGRRMPAWAVACSVIASSLSVATFIGAPEQAFAGDLRYLSATLGAFIAITIVALVFIPAYYREGVSTVYELLERRMGRRAKEAASVAFMAGRVFASGARVYIAALPLTLILFGPAETAPSWALPASILLLCAVGVVYTLWGGISSIIWTDVIQTAVLVLAVGAAALVLWFRIEAPAAEVVRAMSTGMPDGSSKLRVVDVGIHAGAGGWPSIDFALPFTLLTAVVGWSLLNLAAYGTDHDLAQRMLTCKSAVKGSQSAVAAVLLGLPITALFMVIGLLLWVFYTQPQLVGPAAPSGPPPRADQAFVTFIVQEVPRGLAGLMVAGLFAIGLGSLNSAINAMAATFIKDFYERWRPGRSDRHYLVVSRWAVVGWGAVLAAFAIACIRLRGEQKLIDFALGIMNFCYAGLLAVFLTALFTRRGNGRSALAAIVVGFLVVLSLQPWAIAWAMSQWGVQPPFPRVASPWVLLLATSAALAVCCLGRRPAAAAADAGAGAARPGDAAGR